MLKNPRFLSLEIPLVGNSLTLDPDQSAHCCRVLRMKAGEPISLIDGKGSLAEATLIESNPKRTTVKIESITFCERASHVSVAFGLVKPHSLEWIFKKCTEIGVHSFQPLISDHSLHPDSWNSQRWQTIVEEACKQCQEVWFPEIKAPMALPSWLASRSKQSDLIICDEFVRDSKLSPPIQGLTDILIGPEGGWSDSERTVFKKYPFQPLGLGNNRLRSETACIVALALVKSHVGEL